MPDSTTTDSSTPVAPILGPDGEPFPDFTLYGVGFVCASACTRLDDDETTRLVNAQSPTGVSSRWVISDDEAFANGDTNPCPCDLQPATHRHMLFNC